MKKLLRFSGIISLALTIVGLILLMTSYASVTSDGIGFDKGSSLIFGKSDGFITEKFSTMGFFTFGLALAAAFFLVLYVALRLINKDKKRAFLSLVIAAPLLISGASIFFALPKFYERNGYGSFASSGLKIGPGWILAAVLFFIAAAINIANVIIDPDDNAKPAEAK
ncbi:MAG: hypothetical protein J6T25_01465 [Bacilli bacterium]|nr:hypothetical protein [Bacilli bacterium]